MSKTQQILTQEKVLLNAQFKNKEEAISKAGRLLVDAGHVSEEYIPKMLEREELLSTFIGNGVAIPHGTNESKQWIQSTGISFLQIPEGVDFGNGQLAYVVIGIAAVGDEHLVLLANIAQVCSEEENITKLIQAKNPQEIIEMFERGNE